MNIRDFGETATSLSKNPLGIIALFLVLIYACAILFMGMSGDQLKPNERIIFIWFLVLFPVVVLIVFTWLVCKHSGKLYAPTDFKDDRYFLQSQGSEKSDIPQIGKEVQTEAEPRIDQKKKQTISELMKFGAWLLHIPDKEKKIREDMISRGLDTSGDSITLLIHHLAVNQFLTWFEIVYRTIFGSQIFLLKKINEEVSRTVEKGWVADYFGHLQNSIEALSGLPLEEYLRYLFNEGLIITNKNDNLEITAIGNDFLTTMIRFGYSEKQGVL